ncbi:hypothetical protein COCOBI_02-3090 [Coccomyxa sp. Obi]|nr:hypothetical protein COCOBI_02-3090 [Coccomyxa sp. Obi]
MEPTNKRGYFTRSKVALEFKAAGVLPFCILPSGEALALLGAETSRTGPNGRMRKTMWKDFGGSREAIDSDVQDTASREFAEETLGMFASQNVDSASVAASQVLMAAQLRDQRHSLEVVHKLKKGQYSMFIALLPFLDPLMFYLAMRQNAETQAVTGAEKTAFAWVRLDQLLAATARCASAYFLKSSLSVSGTVDGRRPVSHGGRRLMLHPCFASSLRLAQGAGLRKLVAAARKSVQALQQPAPRLLPLAAQPPADQRQARC